MSDVAHNNAQDPTLVRVRLRNDVKCSLQHTNGEPYYQLEDPLNARYYRVGLREWKLVRALDGKRFLRDCVQRLANETDSDSADVLSLKEAVTLVRWLAQVQLVTFEDGKTHPLYEVDPRFRKQPNSFANPLFMRIPLFNPDRLLSRCLPYLAWSVSPVACFVWAAVCLFALMQVVGQWDRFSASFSTILSPNNWLWLLLVWIVLKVLHEFYHGLICKKYGGQVPRCGVVLILFSPIAFVDVTSSWRFRSKWHRIYTAAGGMYIEFFVASLAAILWARTDQPLVAQICENVMTMASVSALLCNANFLMRFDGYYIVTDLLGIQNLYTTGQQYLRYVSRRYLLGVPMANPLEQHSRARLIRVYAYAALVWRWCFYAGILVAASVMFRGAGIVLAVLAAVMWLVVPGLKFLRYLILGTPSEKPNRVRFVTIVGGCAVIVLLVLQLPWPGGISAVGVVQYDPVTIHRVDSPGFVQEVHVQPGQYVKPGHVLATLRNPQTELELAEIDLEIEESRIRSRVLRGDDDVVSYQVEIKKRESLQRQRNELKERVDNLTVVATTTGRVIGRDLQSLVGQYVKTGDTLLSVGDEQKKQIELSIAQKDLDFFVKQLDQHPYVRVKGRSQPLRAATLIRVNPRASRSLPDPAVAAPNGGPLTVSLHEKPSTSEGAAEYELIDPRFSGVIGIPQEQARELRAGELANVRIRAEGDTIGGHLAAEMRRWLSARTESPRG